MRQDPPSDLVHQHKEVVHRLHWQKAQLERAPPALLSGTKHSQKKTEIIFATMTEYKILFRMFLIRIWLLKTYLPNMHSYAHHIYGQMSTSECVTPFSFFTIFAEYENVLRRLVQGLADSVKKYSSQGNRVSAGSESPWLSLLLPQMLYFNG